MIDIDTPTEFDDDSYDPEEEMGSYDASASPWSCLFPEECCMPGPHGPDECYTGAMEDEYEEEDDGGWQPTPPDAQWLLVWCGDLGTVRLLRRSGEDSWASAECTVSSPGYVGWSRAGLDLFHQQRDWWYRAIIIDPPSNPVEQERSCSNCRRAAANAGSTLCNDCLTRLAWSVGK